MDVDWVTQLQDEIAARDTDFTPDGLAELDRRAHDGSIDQWSAGQGAR